MKKLILISLLSLFSLSTFAQIPNYVPSNGLVGWWPFNSNANDESGNGNNGTVNGAILTNDRFGSVGQAYDFDGIGDNISMITLNNIPMGNSARSLSVWMNPSILSNQWTQTAIGYGSPATNNAFMFGLGNNIIAVQGWASDVSAPLLVNIGQWLHTICTYDGFNVKIYVNGILIGYGTNSNWSTIGSEFYFGARPSMTNSFFPGSLDDIGIWNRALTECEIKDLYDSQLGSQSISAGFDQSTCAGDNVILNGSGSSAYQWNNNVVDGASFAPTQTAAYTVSGTDSLGCSGSDTVMVTVLENAANTITQTALDSYTLNGQTYTQSGTYTQTVPAANGCDSTITLNLTLNFTGIHDLGNSTKTLVKITDLNGKTIPRRKNTVMLFIYEDGTVERVVEMEK